MKKAIFVILLVVFFTISKKFAAQDTQIKGFAEGEFTEFVVLLPAS